MTGQLSLFDQAPIACRYPHLSPLSGYRYGCRCPRCCEAHAAWKNPGAGCTIDGCTSLRVKHYRYCAEHVIEARAMRELERTHATPHRVGIDTQCEVCGRQFTFYAHPSMTAVRQEINRRSCSACRGPYRGQIANHRLTADLAIRLMRLEACELLGCPLPTRDFRRVVEVDHDHDCCSGDWSCGDCVRGFVCKSCNLLIAAYERTREHEQSLLEWTWRHVTPGE